MINQYLNLVNYDSCYLDNSWKWLNDPEIKKLTNSPNFSRKDQLKWYNRLSNKKDYKIWGIQFNSIPIGVCGIKALTLTDGEYWGFIGDKQYWGMGFGSMILQLIEEKAKEFDLKSLWLMVSIDNKRAIHLYYKNGYKDEKFQNNFIKMRKTI
jgi:RimJ/RimL family protein N-acetyltransferase